MALVLIAIRSNCSLDKSWETILALGFTRSIPPLSTCASLFSVGYFSAKQIGSCQVHTLFDVVTKSPLSFVITESAVSRRQPARQLPIETRPVNLFDRATLILLRLFRSALMTARSFVTPRKKIIFAARGGAPKNCGDRGCHKPGVKVDQEVYLTHFYAKKKIIPQEFRPAIRLWTKKLPKKLTFLTNNFDWSASTVALIVENRVGKSNSFQMDQATSPA